MHLYIFGSILADDYATADNNDDDYDGNNNNNNNNNKIILNTILIWGTR
jgi:hypothetical protein